MFGLDRLRSSGCTPMKMLALMLTVLSILSGSLNAQQPDHDTVGAVPDEATKSLLTARFKRGLDIAGIMGVGKDVQACYDDAYLPKTNAAKLSKCMLYDSAAYRMDKGMHGVMAMRGETFDQVRYFADAPVCAASEFLRQIGIWRIGRQGQSLPCGLLAGSHEAGRSIGAHSRVPVCVPGVATE
jgi:hypothetical protein